MIDYEQALLKRGEAFRAKLAKAQPNHPELGFINADIAARRTRIDSLGIQQVQEQPVEAEAPTIDPRQATYDLLATVREPSLEEQEALKDRFVFLRTEAKPLKLVVFEHPDHFWDWVRGFVDERPNLRDFTPPAMTVGFNVEELALAGGFSKTQDRQLAMIGDVSLALQTEFPDARMIMLPASTYAQADLAHLELKGEKLFKTYYARALDQTVGSDVAIVGRNHPGSQLRVGDWFADRGFDIVGAVPAVVFVWK